MQHLLIKIIKQKTIPISLTDKDMLDFPVHSHFMVEVEEKLIIYKFEPTRKTAEKIEQLTEMLRKHFKQKYNAYSVEIGQLQHQLQPN